VYSLRPWNTIDGTMRRAKNARLIYYVAPVTSLHDLGVHLDSDMSMHTHQSREVDRQSPTGLILWCSDSDLQCSVVLLPGLICCVWRSSDSDLRCSVVLRKWFVVIQHWFVVSQEWFVVICGIQADRCILFHKMSLWEYTADILATVHLTALGSCDN